ncbi:MAG: glyoxalase, partial [Solirubrobacterales bacterium]|nr:glyoxalase [Solirubrobacterales bacterium]
MPITVTPAFRVSSRTVLDQWVEAFGFELVLIIGEGDEVGHAELRLGDGWVMAGTAKRNEFDTAPGATGSYWVLDDVAAVDAMHARALAAGATSINEPYEPPYGGRECSLRDL